MSRKTFDIEALRFWPGLIITVASLSIAILVDIYLLPDKGKMVGFAFSASLLAIYTARPVLRYSGAKAFLFGYIILHIALVFIPLTDSSFPGLVLVPFFMADYVAMVFGLRAFTAPTMNWLAILEAPNGSLPPQDAISCHGNAAISGEMKLLRASTDNSRSRE